MGGPGAANVFEGPWKVAALVGGFGGPWYVAGGWVLDLFLGRVSRAHADIEIAVCREDGRAIETCHPGDPWLGVL